MLLAPVIRDRKGEHLHIFEQMRAAGFIRVRVDGILVDLDDVPALDKKRKHSIDVVIDTAWPRSSTAEMCEVAIRGGDGSGAKAVPVAGVPAGEREELLQTVAALPADVSVLLIEHDMDMVFSFATRMTVLVNGAVLTEGTPQEIAADPRVKAVYLGHGEGAGA